MFNALKLAVPAAVLAMGLAVSGAEAAPAAGGMTPLKAVTETSTTAENVRWVKKCSWHRGHRHCRSVWVGPRRNDHRHHGNRHRSHRHDSRHNSHRHR